MTTTLPLDSLVTVKGRFVRSVSLARDFDRPDALAGYLLTPTGRDVLGRLAAALRGDSPTRAWSLTGPYGSGKSAFALLVARLLGGDPRDRREARELVRAEDPQLWERLFGDGSPLSTRAGRLCPVLISGSKQPLEPALAGRLAFALRRTSPRGRPPGVVERLEEIAARPDASGTEVVRLYEEAIRYLDRFGREGAGLLLIIDELGKFLEYGAGHPDRGDVFVLQELAEAATRCGRPFLFVTILHQSLHRYADHLAPRRRREWEKVQGRFEDVAFEERAEQVLRLLAHAVRRRGPEDVLRPLDRQAREAAAGVAATGVRVGSLSGDALRDCLAGCFPLHPLAALAVGPLFRQLAQNERSLFAFLSSAEPFGFQEFLRRHAAGPGECETYRLDQLYDYVTAAVGPALYTLHRGRVWAEVQGAVERLRDATPLELRLAKAIGTLQALGPAAPAPASQAVLRLALKGPGVGEGEVDAALDALARRSLAVFRRHLGGYALWEGSDIDVEARMGDARRAVDRGFDLAAFLTREFPPPPLVARRHYFQKGTLRYFEARYADRESLPAELTREDGEADGRVIFCLPGNPEDREAMAADLGWLGTAAPSAVAVLPGEVADLRELCYEVVCLRWVSQHTPELETDRTARREVHARLGHAEQSLRAHLGRTFSAGRGIPACGSESAGGASPWRPGQFPPNRTITEQSQLGLPSHPG